MIKPNYRGGQDVCRLLIVTNYSSIYSGGPSINSIQLYIQLRTMHPSPLSKSNLYIATDIIVYQRKADQTFKQGRTICPSLTNLKPWSRYPHLAFLPIPSSIFHLPYSRSRPSKAYQTSKAYQISLTVSRAPSRSSVEHQVYHLYSKPLVVVTSKSFT